MNTAANTEAVSTRNTFDGVRVKLHANGEISDRLSFFRGRLPVDQMWFVWEDITLYTHAEIPALLRAVRAGKFTRFQVKPSIDHEGIMAMNRARRMEKARAMNESRKVRGLRAGEW